MSYQNIATADTPALVIFVLDCSGSMHTQPCGDKKRIEVVQQALEKVIIKMVQRSTRGARVRPRYRIAIIAYSNEPENILGDDDTILTIEDLAQTGVPLLPETGELTRTREAFSAAEELLAAEVPNLKPQDPAPLVLHLTDGEFSPGSDPTSTAQRIMDMDTPDGKVLVGNVYITDKGLPIKDVMTWPGIQSENDVPEGYARTLFRISSPIPDSYRAVMGDWGYVLEPGARWFLPGNQPELIQLGFAISGATPISRAR